MKKNTIWKHFIIDLNNVGFNKFINFNQIGIEKFIIDTLSLNWLTVLWSNFHFFWNINSFTWVVLLAESHFSIHTWPEIWYVSIDLFSCNFIKDYSCDIENVLEKIILELFEWEIILDKKIINR